MKTIAIEEHFHTNNFLDYLRSRKENPKRQVVFDKTRNRDIEHLWSSSGSYNVRLDPELDRKIHVDIGYRLGEMDKTGISMQVLSLATPGVESFDAATGIYWAHQTNDELASWIHRYPDRFTGFAALPVQSPLDAAIELERSVKQLGLKGALINSHVNGEYLDDKKYWPIFEKAEELNVPIYLHPREPSPDMLKPFLAYPMLASAMWGFGADAGLHALRLICSGVFDVFPKLKIILGHLGEALPYWIWRLDNKSGVKNLVKRKPSEYIRDNVLISGSGMLWQPSLLCAYLTLGADKIMFAVDYPYEDGSAAIKFMEEAPICLSDKEKIMHLNAETIFSL